MQFAWEFFELFSPLPTTKNIQKTHQNFLVLLSSPKIQGIVLIPNLLSLDFIPWDSGFRGVDVEMAIFARLEVPGPTRP